MSIVSKLKTSSWSINDIYSRINYGCWGYEDTCSGLFGLYVWGHNPHGEQGYSRTGADSHIPILVGEVSCWNQASTDDMGGYYYVMATKSDGTAWAWGHNPYGALGNGATSSRSSPTQVLGTNWRSTAAGNYHAVGVKCDGTLWTWGYNGHGELGTNNTITYSAPNQVGSCTDWCCGHAGGHHHTFGLKCNGTLWSWGHNNHGDLGDGTTINRSSPVQVPGAWCCAKGRAPTIAKKTDGTHWTWGHNPHGAIGDGSTANRSSPVLLPGCWLHVSSTSTKHHALAGVKSDNTLWVWGHNPNGDAGCCNCYIGQNLSPIQVSGNDWCCVGVGYNQVYGVKTNGTLWGWGSNPHGNIDNTGNARCSPQQILGNNWKDVSGGHWMTIARSKGVSINQEGINFNNYPSVYYQSFCCY